MRAGRSRSQERLPLGDLKAERLCQPVPHLHCQAGSNQPGASLVAQVVKNLLAMWEFHPELHPWAGKISWRKAWQPTPVFLPGESHRQRSLVGYSPWGRKDSDMTERLTPTQTYRQKLVFEYRPILAFYLHLS